MQKFDLRAPLLPFPAMHGCSLCMCGPVRSQSDSCLLTVTAALRTHAHATYAGGQDNKVEHNLLLQQISTVDENGQAVVKGTKVSRGYYADNGPPTTLSGTGEDAPAQHASHAVSPASVSMSFSFSFSQSCLLAVPYHASDRHTLRHLAVGRGGRTAACYTP